MRSLAQLLKLDSESIVHSQLLRDVFCDVSKRGSAAVPVGFLKNDEIGVVVEKKLRDPI